MNDNKPTRCMECTHIRYSSKLQYYPHWYCKIAGEEVHFCEKNGQDRMKWCPLDKDGEQQ